MSMIGGGYTNFTNNIENESDTDNNDITEVTKNNKNVKNSDPSGINFKSKLPDFKKSVEMLRKVLRKGSVKVLGKI